MDAPESGGPPRRPSRPPFLRNRALRRAALGAAVLHTLAVLWIWSTWEVGLRSGWLVWMDLPVSLLFVEARGLALLAASLVLGGLWWACVGALLSAAVALVVGRR